MQKPLHIDKTKASRKDTLSEEYSLRYTIESEAPSESHAEEEDLEFIHSVYQTIVSECRFASQAKLTNIPRFSRNEIIEGLTLGKGGFGTINAVRGFSLSTKKERYNVNIIASSEFDYEESIRGGEMESKHFIARHCLRSNGDARYALKRLQRSTLDDNLECLRGMTDLANETLFLGSIDHPHIIKLRAIGEADMCCKDFFIILDRLYDTLASRLMKWKREEKKLSGLKRIFRKGRAPKRKDLLADRLNYASQLASALVYLHRHKVVHRDLKPDNIGFDVRGDIKIFDFGLARELPRKSGRSSCTTFNLTMNAGTPRYMAPEVSTGKYNEACDIYSTGLLLWEFITLKRPFKEQQCLEDFEQNVWSPNGPQCRPKIPAKESAGLRHLLIHAWNHDLDERPSAVEFENTLRCEISKLITQDESSEAEMDSELYSATILSSPVKGTKKPSRFAKRSKSTILDGPLVDPVGTTEQTFLMSPGLLAG